MPLHHTAIVEFDMVRIARAAYRTSVHELGEQGVGDNAVTALSSFSLFYSYAGLICVT
jgi:hypothetical protein